MQASCTKGIILAGGTGSRMYPMSVATNKQLLPIFDKPVIYYPLSTLLLAGITEILIICNPEDLANMQRFLGDGSQWNINIKYAVQYEPKGIADAFIISEKFIDKSPVALILGDNFFHGNGFSAMLQTAAQQTTGAQIFAYVVKEPWHYGVVELNSHGDAIGIEEKPKPGQEKSNYAITGLYFYDHEVCSFAKKLTPSKRGELEISDLNALYLQKNKLKVHILSRGFVWFDVGTPHNLANASKYVDMLQDFQGVRVNCPEEIAWRMGLISDTELLAIINRLPKSTYSDYLKHLLKHKNIHSQNSNIIDLPKRRKGDL